MTTDPFDPDAELCEVPAGDTFADPADDFDADADDLAGNVFALDGKLRDGDYWTGPGADDDEARETGTP